MVMLFSVQSLSKWAQTTTIKLTVKWIKLFQQQDYGKQPIQFPSADKPNMICMKHFTTIGITLLIYGVHGSILDSLKPSDYPLLMDDRLETKWRSDDLKKESNIPGVCRQLELHIIETSLSGRMTQTECGLAGYKILLLPRN